ncbi:hypothetical protein [Flavobacterium covae]|uniref:hypothetical protein n=1 Tax=Flavobacterium covae TaxID=2906076 RepID=UPI00119D0BD0|nr:hypothetical protein [Flavobacterium covae]MCJ1809884.1 hypothetical protein [Flavobacterium covae]
MLWVTNGASSSLKALTQSQAVLIIKALTGQEVEKPAKKSINDNWALFDKHNEQHKYILSLLIQMGWSVENERYGEVADMYRLSDWLKSEKSPVRKALTKMTPIETSKIISALESMNTKHHSK